MIITTITHSQYKERGLDWLNLSSTLKNELLNKAHKCLPTVPMSHSEMTNGWYMRCAVYYAPVACINGVIYQPEDFTSRSKTLFEDLEIHYVDNNKTL